MITLGTATITEKATLNLAKCCLTERLGQGEFIEKFEGKIAKFVGTKHAISTCNGSMAVIVVLAAFKHLYPDKTEVIVPALTFIAQTNAVIINGLKPVFVDVGYDYQINTSLIKNVITDNTLAIAPTHLLGKKCNIEKIIEIAGNIPILEDSCETFGVKPKLVATYSFYPSHTITTGEGGVIVTDDDELADLCRKIRSHGRLSENFMETFHFDIIGFNGRMSNVTAAIGDAAIELADEAIKKRKENVKVLNRAIGQDWYAESPHCYPIMCEAKTERNLMMMELYNNGIEARKIFSSLPTQEKVYQYMKYELGDFPVAEDIGDRGLYVPIHQNLSDKNLEKICQNIKPL